MYCGSKPNAAHGIATHWAKLMPPPMIKSSTARPPHTDAQDTNESRNFATILGSPLGVRSDFGSFLVGRVERRRSSGPPRPPPDIRAGGGGPNRVSPRAPPLLRRGGRYGGDRKSTRLNSS